MLKSHFLGGKREEKGIFRFEWKLNHPIRKHKTLGLR